MGLVRAALLAGSESVWLREHAMRHRSVRRAVARFMPGERVEDALAAAASLRGLGIGAVLTSRYSGASWLAPLLVVKVTGE